MIIELTAEQESQAANEWLEKGTTGGATLGQILFRDNRKAYFNYTILTREEAEQIQTTIDKIKSERNSKNNARSF